MAEGVAVHKSDLEAWRSYSFRREVRRERLDSKGEVDWSLEFTLVNTPTESGFDEELIEVEGRAPTAEEIEDHGDAARFTKHYLNVLAGKVDNPLAGDNMTLPAIWEETDHTYVGLETIDGVETHRVDFVPNAAAKGAMVEKLANSIAGSLWLTVDGNHLVKWETRLTRPLKRALIKMKKLDLTVTCQPVGDAYFAKEVEMDSVVSLGFGDKRKRNRYRYSEFEKSVPGG